MLAQLLEGAPYALGMVQRLRRDHEASGPIANTCRGSAIPQLLGMVTPNRIDAFEPVWSRDDCATLAQHLPEGPDRGHVCLR